MLIFFLFFIEAFSKIIVIKFDSQAKVQSLPEFGFEKGGKLIITLFGFNFTGVKLYLLTPILKEIFHRSNNTNFFCANTVNHLFSKSIQLSEEQFSKMISVKPVFNMENLSNSNIVSPKDHFFFQKNNENNLNESSHTFNNGIGRISINISISNIYFPIITNCNRHDKITAVAQYLNNQSFLDTREKRIQHFYTVESVIYFLFLLVWLINGLFHPLFSINIHYLFAFSCLSKVFSLYFSCLKWENRQKFESVKKSISIGQIISRGFSFSVTMTSNIVASSGLGVYKPSSFIEVVLISLISVVLFFSMYMSEENFMELRVVGIVSCIIEFVLLIQFIKNGIESTSSFLNFFNGLILFHDSPNLFSKINLVIGFIYALSIIMISYIFFFFVSFVIDSKMMKTAVRECSEMLFYLVDMIFFLYRDSYHPLQQEPAERRRRTRNNILLDLDVLDDISDNSELRDEQKNKQFTSRNCRIIQIDDPNQNEISLISP